MDCLRECTLLFPAIFRPTSSAHRQLPPFHLFKATNKWTTLASALSLLVTSAGTGKLTLQRNPRDKVLILPGNANVMAKSLYAGSAPTQVLDVNIKKARAKS